MTTHVPVIRRSGAFLLAFSIAAVMLMFTVNAGAAVVAKVPLATAANYSVLAGSTVTNTGGSVLNKSLGLWPGTSVTGFPPGHVVPPGTINKTNAAAHQAKLDLTTAYVNAAGRPVTATTTANLANKHLGAGVYSGPSKSALSLTGPLVLDGAGDPTSVFIFQTNSTLITASASTVTLINGAQECNVFWQVGSSATIGSGSVFRGNILALTSITVNNGVTVHGRALAREAAVTLINDTFTTPTCSLSTGGGGTPTTTPTGGGSTPTVPGGGTATPNTPGGSGGPGTDGGPGTPNIVGPPRTGGAPTPETSAWPELLFLGVLGAAIVGSARAHLLRR